MSILDTDERKDIAILKVKATNLPALTTIDSNAVKIGATVYAISNPKGLENSLSSGLISSIRSAEGFRVFQFTAAISPGSSGGALLDDNGSFIGLAFASFRDGQNLNLAIPANHVVPLALNAKNEGQWLAKMTGNPETVATRFIGDYRYKKFLWVDRGKWILSKAG